MEIIVVLALLLVVFGPKRLPELGRGLGGGMREFKQNVTGDGNSTIGEPAVSESRKVDAEL
jgi:sec-independent protein translocase protein TatA